MSRDKLELVLPAVSWMVLVIIDKFPCVKCSFSCSIMQLCIANSMCYTNCVMRCDGQVSQIAVGRISLYLIVSFLLTFVGGGVYFLYLLLTNRRV